MPVSVYRACTMLECHCQCVVDVIVVLYSGSRGSVSIYRHWPLYMLMLTTLN